MQQQVLVEQIAKLSQRISRLEQQLERRRYRNQQAATMTATGGYFVNTGRGLCGCRHHEEDPDSQEYEVGETVIHTLDPHAEYHSLLPVWWVIPAKQGNVESLVRFTFSDATTVDHRNTSGSNVEQTHPLDVLFFKDGVTCVQVQFICDNMSVSPETQDVGVFTDP